MIVPGMPMPLMGKTSGWAGPIATMSAGDSGLGDYYGFVRPGSYLAGAFGTSYGSLTGTLLEGEAVNSVVTISDSSTLVFFSGDILAQLPPSLVLVVNGVTTLAENSARGIEGGESAMSFELFSFAPSTTYSLQLVEG